MSERTGSPLAGKYGPWAVVAGASDGLGAAFASYLAASGFNLVLIARRAELLEANAARLREVSGVQVRTIALDLAQADLANVLAKVAGDVEVGLAVYNAAFAPIGAFGERPLEDLLRVVDVNVRGPLVFARTFAPKMAGKRRGGIVLMSSLAGDTGGPKIATYAASKAFNTILAQGLWREFRDQGVDVLACSAGAIRTPGYKAAAGKDAPGTLDADVVVKQTLAALGRGPSAVPGAVNKIARFVLGRLLPRRTAINIFAQSTKDLS